MCGFNMDSLRKMFFACVMYTILLQSVSQGDSKTEEYLVNVAKLLAGALDEVTELRKDMKTLQAAVFGEGYHAEVLPGNTRKPTQNKPVTVSISATEGDEIVFGIDHQLENIVNVKWMVDYILQPETKYKQVRESGHVSLVINSTDLQHTRKNQYAHAVVANIEMISGDIFQFSFNLSTAYELTNSTSGLTENSVVVSEDIDLYTLTVSPSTNIGYTPGDELELSIDRGSRNDSQIMWTFMAVSEKPDDPFAVVIQQYFENAPVNISEEFKSGKSVIKATIDTTLLKTGGIIFLREIERVGGRAIGELWTVQPIYLHLRTQTAPIPINRVAVDNSEFSARQNLWLESDETPVRCEAIGNPAPYMEFRIGGYTVDVEYGEWSWAYGNIIYAYIPNSMLGNNVTCRAESGTAVAEMTIELYTFVTVVEESTGMKRISDDLAEVACTMRGNPAPTISFFKSYESPDNLITEDQDNVEISTSSAGFTTTSKLLFKTSDFDQLWSIVCSGKSDEEETSKYIAIQ